MELCKQNCDTGMYQCIASVGSAIAWKIGINDEYEQQQRREHNWRQTSGNKSMHSVHFNEVQIDKFLNGLRFNISHLLSRSLSLNHIILLLFLFVPFGCYSIYTTFQESVNYISGSRFNLWISRIWNKRIHQQFEWKIFFSLFRWIFDCLHNYRYAMSRHNSYNNNNSSSNSNNSSTNTEKKTRYEGTKLR